MRAAIGIFLTGFFAVAGWAGLALAQKRTALVIGNSAYQYTGRLANPKNDATDISAVLKKLGFQVTEGFDLDKAAFDRKVRDFAAALRGSEVGLFFYAGHGLQVAGQNYLVPVDAQLTTPSALDFEMVRADVVHRIMEHETNTNIIFLDACRDNPLARNLARAMGTRSAEIGRGFALVASGVGTLISFSTQPGNVALDGTGRNSPFAGALVKHLVAAKDDLSAILIEVRNDVMKETQNKQVPWEHSALRGRFYFNTEAQTTIVTPVATTRLSEAAEAWGATKDTRNIAVLEAFITRYKDTFYAELARAQIEDLKNQQIAVATPPPVAKAPAIAPPVAKPEPLISSSSEFPGGGHIEMTVMFGAGSASDVTARQLAEGMAKVLGAPVPVVNRTGAGGAVGYLHLSQQKPDGYAIVWSSNSISTNFHSGQLPFDYKNLEHVARVTIENPAIAVKASSPWKTLKELVDYAKANPEKVRVGNSGAASHTHIAAVALFNAAGAKITSVPFSAGQATVNLLGDRIEAAVQFPQAFVSHVKSGDLRVLAMLGTIPDPSFPDVKTAKQQGYNVGLELWRGISVPKGTPKAAIAKLQDAVKKTVESPEFKEAGKKIGFTPAFLPTDAFTKMVAEDDAQLGAVMKQIGLKRQ